MWGVWGDEGGQTHPAPLRPPKGNHGEAIASWTEVATLFACSIPRPRLNSRRLPTPFQVSPRDQKLPVQDRP